MNVLGRMITLVVKLLFPLLGPSVTVEVEPPEISGNASDVAINLTCTVTFMENASYYQSQLDWIFNGAPIGTQMNTRIMVWTYYLCM